jgi:translation initiation factor IF-2
MQQRQLRLGDILDDYCPRERRVTNHAVVAMVGADVKQTRCTTCDAEHEYKHARVPRQRRKAETPAALYSQVAAGAPKRVAHDGSEPGGGSEPIEPEAPAETATRGSVPPDTGDDPMAISSDDTLQGESQESLPDEGLDGDREEGPVHRPLIRASLPRPEGQPPPTRPVPEFTIRQPGGRQNRFRPRHFRAGQGFQGDRPGAKPGGQRDGMPRQGGRPPQGALSSRLARRHGPGRKRSK